MKRLSVDEVKIQLKNANIALIGEYRTTRTHTEFMCLKDGCGYKWITEPRTIIHNRSGCPKCGDKIKKQKGEKRFLSNKIIDERLQNRTITRLGDYVNAKTPILFLCNDCDYKWMSNTDNITTKNKGCPRCAHCIKLTNEYVDNSIIDKNIKRLDDVNGVDTKIEFLCLEKDCNAKWKTTPYCIVNLGTGCPQCKFKNEKLVASFLQNNNISYELHKKLKHIFPIEYGYSVDFYLPDQNVVVEYNGAQHYEAVRFGGRDVDIAETAFEKQKLRDEFVNNFCAMHNIKIIWIDGREYQGRKLKQHLSADVLQSILAR